MSREASAMSYRKRNRNLDSFGQSVNIDVDEGGNDEESSSESSTDRHVFDGMESSLPGAKKS
jgi:hypothetical protein